MLRLGRYGRRDEDLVRAGIRNLIMGVVMMPVAGRNGFAAGRIGAAQMSHACHGALHLRNQQSYGGEHNEMCARHPDPFWSIPRQRAVGLIFRCGSLASRFETWFGISRRQRFNK